MDMLKTFVSDIRKLKGKYKMDEVYVSLNSKNIESVIYYHNLIEKLTKVKIIYFEKGLSYED